MRADGGQGRPPLNAEGRDELGGAGGHGHTRLVAEIAAGGGEVEPVILGEFGGDEARHRWLGGDREHAPKRFADGTDGRCGGERKTTRDRWFAEGGEELVDPVPEDNGFTVGDEVRPAAGGRRLRAGKGLFGGEVGVDGVGNVDHVDAVGAIADDAETTGPGAGENARDEMRITDAPDQVWTEGDGAEAGGRGGVSGEDFAFGDGLG